MLRFKGKLFFIIFLLWTIVSMAFAGPTDSWLANALQLQREIDINAPLNEATFIGTHNSYNSKAYQQSIFRYFDPNQILSLKEQLEAGVRSIELDLHWSLTGNFSKEILLCHGYSNHLGCSLFDRPFSEGLAELRDWLAANPNEVVLLYLERFLDGHEPRMAAQLETYLGKFIYKTSNISTHKGTSCISLPPKLTKADILKAGKQLLIVSKLCNQNESYAETNLFPQAWTDYVFTGIGYIPTKCFDFIDAIITDYKGYPDCTIKNVFKTDAKHTSLWRIYEDRTKMSNLRSTLKKILAKDVHELMHCDINWPALDMLKKNDERLAASIWSWAQAYPKKDNGKCAAFEINKGIINLPCHHQLGAFACRNHDSRELKVISYLGAWQDGEIACQAIAGRQWHFAVPTNGRQLNHLRLILVADLKQVWLNYAVNSDGHWQTDLIGK